jgi:hypothetical protein
MLNFSPRKHGARNELKMIVNGVVEASKSTLPRVRAAITKNKLK